MVAMHHERQTAPHPARKRETYEVAMARLAVEAECAGIQVHHYGNKWFATSQSDRHHLHRVTLYSCDCQGFQHHQRCRHLARLLDVTGNLPGVDLPIGQRRALTVTCPRWWGAGMIGQDDQWCSQCPDCGGSGTVVKAA